jgi:hypothetical protein
MSMRQKHVTVERFPMPNAHFVKTMGNMRRSISETTFNICVNYVKNGPQFVSYLQKNTHKMLLTKLL